MSILTVDQLAKSYGGRMIFHAVCFRVEEKDRLGFVGANGAGKTTLFRLLTGKEEPDEGRVIWASGARVGTMEQHVPESTDVTAADWMLAAFAPLLELEKDMATVQRILEIGGHTADLLQRQQNLREQYERAGGLTFRSRADAALTGLGFTPKQKQLPLASLSGGQRSKIGLARLLVSGADCLLLDEPTNHLDLQAIVWLEDYLRQYDGALIVVSHDRYFLDRVTTGTMELEHGALQTFGGSYTPYMSFKKQQRAAAQAHYDQQMKEIRRLEGVVEEMHRWGREKAVKRADSKQKVIDKLTENLEKPPAELRTIRFSFPVRHPGPTEVLTARDLAVSFGQTPLYAGLNLALRKGERVFLAGPNGCGKTTLLRHLLGKIPGAGTVLLGPGVSVGYYDQTQQQLHPAKTVLDEVWDDYPAMTQTALRNALAAFLFTGDDVNKTVAACSGGERARIAFLKTMLQGCNLLLLDEPTNHLDIGSREALEDALAGYEGTLLMVSHDRYFINKLATRVLLFTPDGPQPVARGDEGYDLTLPQTAPAVKKAGPGSGGRDYQLRKQRESTLRKLQTAVARAEAQIEQLEQEADRLLEQMNDPAVQSDYEQLLAVSTAREANQQALEAATARWEQYADELERLQNE